MLKRFLLIIHFIMLLGCSSSHQSSEPITIGILAFNDLHGNLEPPAITVPVMLDGELVQVPAGGMSYLSSAIYDFKQRYQHHLVVSAGDMISASPLISSLFLDEPTIYAVNEMAIDFNAVGNHEFDRGRDELLRLQQGGCEQYTLREPCQVRSYFPGANFALLGANTLIDDGQSLLPRYGIKKFKHGSRDITVGVVGVTTRETASSVSQSGIVGLTFTDEATAANKAALELKQAGADILVLVIHEGGATNTTALEVGCDGLHGDIVPILNQLSDSFSVVISGHTHRAYVCDYQTVNQHKPLLLTSAGEKGSLVTEIELLFDPKTGTLTRKQGQNKVVQGEAIRKGNYLIELEQRLPIFSADPKVSVIIDEYKHAAEALSGRVVGYAKAAITRDQSIHGESQLGQVIADMQLYVANQDRYTRADLSFMNTGGMRADLQPNLQGELTFGDIYAVLPFGNQLVTKSYTGAQLYQILEEQFASGTNTLETPRILQVSVGVSYTADLTQEKGARIKNFLIDGQPVIHNQRYRVVTHTFLAEGGDNFLTFAEGLDRAWGAIDVDAFEHYLRDQPELNISSENRIHILR